MKSLILVLGAALIAAALAWGQATAQMHGVVSDMSGAAIPGAMVKATQTETGISRTVTTEADGSYILSNPTALIGGLQHHGAAGAILRFLQLTGRVC